MRRRLPGWWNGVLVTILAWTTVAYAQTVPTQALRSSVEPSALEEFLVRGGDYERQRNWQQAADVYERALRLYPDQTNLRERWNKAERLYSISRRYHDHSYLHELLGLSQEQALDLYREVLSKIQSHYVEEVPLERLVQLGYQNLALAVSESIFVETNGSQTAVTLLPRLREEFAQRSQRKIDSVAAAEEEVAYAGNLCRKYGLRSPVPVLLEFLTAASEGLDPYSAHLTPNRLRDLYAMIDGNFVGLGVEVRGVRDGLQIVQVLPGSPAEQARLREGEVLFAVDRQPIAGVNAEDAANRLQGQEGSTVLLGVLDARGNRREIAVARREVIVHSITRAELIDPVRGVGYIRLATFQKLTVRELEQAVAQLEQRGMKSLVLDLRGNPGGLLDVSLQVANHFIDQGVLVSTQGRAWGQSWSHRARPTAIWTFPLAVLVDGDSASASEIFAGAVKDHERGTIVGTRTFGKGSVQSIFPLRAASTGLRLTTAHFYSPKGKVLQGVGVMPDVVVARPLAALGEETPPPREPNLETDVQLRRAHSVLAQSFVTR